MEFQKGHIRWLDSLRGLGAVGVVLFHLTQPGPRAVDVYQDLMQPLWLGVPMFFVVSGFSIQTSVQRSPTSLDFLNRRFWRIYPPYLASFLLIALIAIFGKIWTGTNDIAVLPKTIWEAAHVLTLTTWPVSATPGANWVYWSLSFEAAFYILVSLVIILPRLKWLWLFGLGFAALFHAGQAPLPAGSAGGPLFFLGPWSTFGLGVALAEWRLKSGPLPILLMVISGTDQVLNQDALPAITALLTAVTIQMCQTSWGGWLNRERLFSTIGTWSYSLYLLHVPLGIFIMGRWAQNLRYHGAAVHALVDFSILMVCIGAAALSWKYIEAPSASLHRLFPAPNGREPTSERIAVAADDRLLEAEAAKRRTE